MRLLVALTRGWLVTCLEGYAHIVTVNPFGAIPDRVLDVIARFASPRQER